MIPRLSCYAIISLVLNAPCSAQKLKSGLYSLPFSLPGLQYHEINCRAQTLCKFINVLLVSPITSGDGMQY